MSRTSLFWPRRHRALRDHPATDTHLLPNPFPPNILHINPHYKRCPKAHRLRLRSDQSPSRPLHGRSPDKSRRPLSKGLCQVRAPLTRRIRFASSGDAHEHGVKLLTRAIAPRDSTVATFGEAVPLSGGRESTPPFLRMAGHFWWSRTPHSETSSLLLHILLEVRGCRRAVTNVKHPLKRTPRIGTGVDAISRNRPGPSIPSPSPTSLLRHSRPRSGIQPRKGRVSAPRGVPSLPTHPLRHVIPMPCEESGVGLPPLPVIPALLTPSSPTPIGNPALEGQGVRSSGHTFPPRPRIQPLPTPQKTKFPNNNQKSRLSPHINQNSLSPLSGKEQTTPLTRHF